MLDRLSRLFDMARAIAGLPTARLEFRLHINPDDVRMMHRHFTRRHPKYLIFQNKSIGAALVDLRKFHTAEEYLSTVGGHSSAAYYTKRAKKKGYQLVEIDKNDFIDDIYEINTSIELRQGRPMDAAYREKITRYPIEKNYKYFGVLNTAGKLVAYGDLGSYGNFVAFNRVIGLRNSDGIVHLMLTEIIGQLIEQRNHHYIMYDTYFGASAGMQNFKTKLGFEPYRAKYSIQ